MLYPRDILTDIKKVLNHDQFIILSGARQTGKTSLLIMLKDFLENAGAICHYFNLENPDYLKLLNKHPFNIFELIPSAKVKQSIFIDEVQYLDDPSNFLKLLYDQKRNKLKIYASGSSAFYIDKKFKDSLAGRKFLFEIYPLNFDEFLVFSGQEELLNQKGKKLSVYYRKKLFDLWDKYLIYGGYPKVVLEDDEEIKRIILEEIGTSYIKKDISDAGIKNTEKYFSLLKILAGQVGKLVNFHELANTLGIARKTVEGYYYVIKKSYQAAFITPFYRNLRKELTRMPKVFFYDSGLRNFFLNDYTPLLHRRDKGEYLENIAFRELLRTAKTTGKIKFWRTQDKKEVDFIMGNEAFEIKFSKSEKLNRKYKQFEEEYPQIKLTFLTYYDFLEKFYLWKL